MITQKEVKETALADLISNLKKCKELAKVSGFSWVYDCDLDQLIEQAEYEYQEELDS